MKGGYLEYNPILMILRNFGTINMSTFEKRVRLQKLAYLAQKFGGYNRYTFGFYNNGPYSSSLDNDLNRCVTNYIFSTKPKLLKEELKIVSLLKILLGKEIKNHKSLVLFTSIWYLLPSFRKISKKEQKEILDNVCNKNFYFDDIIAKKALKTIMDFKKEYY